tara:strand:- start:26241 stop:26771 length:531 start_codon:yes stop_codon:yes gene_type:complete
MTAIGIKRSHATISIDNSNENNQRTELFKQLKERKLSHKSKYISIYECYHDFTNLMYKRNEFLDIMEAAQKRPRILTISVIRDYMNQLDISMKGKKQELIIRLLTIYYRVLTYTKQDFIRLINTFKESIINTQELLDNNREILTDGLLVRESNILKNYYNILTTFKERMSILSTEI